MKGMINIERLRAVAEEYAENVKSLKAIEADTVTPFKTELLDAAKKLELSETLDLGAVKLVPRTTQKASLKQSAVTPDWLYRWQKAGGKVKTELVFDESIDDMDALLPMLDEVGYEVEYKQSVGIVVGK